jgi:hypothetical protein
MWPMEELLDTLTTTGILSRQYREKWAGKRPPMVVRLPDGSDFLLDGARREAAKGLRRDGQGYTVTEANGRYSVEEILDNGRWRGYLRDGALVEESQFLAEQKKAKQAQPPPVPVTEFRQG